MTPFASSPIGRKTIIEAEGKQEEHKKETLHITLKGRKVLKGKVVIAPTLHPGKDFGLTGSNATIVGLNYDEVEEIYVEH